MVDDIDFGHAHLQQLAIIRSAPAMNTLANAAASRANHPNQRRRALPEPLLKNQPPPE